MPYVDQVKKNNLIYDIYDIRIPDPPTASGNYTLSVLVVDGVPTFRWITGTQQDEYAEVSGNTVLFHKGATVSGDDITLTSAAGYTTNHNLVIN